MKHTLFYFIIFFTYLTFGQKKYSKEITFITDNDLYVSAKKDRYYTSGIFFNYRYITNSQKEHIEKKIIDWQLVHEIFTPYTAITRNIFDHDRPFAGHLYGSFGIDYVYKKKQILKTSLQIGVLGSNSYAQELQSFIHNIYGFKEAKGWQYQIKNAFSLNLEAEYVKFLLKNNKNTLDLTWVNSAKLGTVYTNISSGLHSRIGLKPLQSIINSIGFNSNLNTTKNNYFREVESFLYLKPTLSYALYDATIQGSFLNTSSEVTRELIPLVFNFEIGLRFTANRFNFGYSFHYNTKNIENLRYTSGHKYGSILVSYMLH